MNVAVLENAAETTSSYWRNFLQEIGLNLVEQEISDTEALEIGQQSLLDEPLSVQLALGRLLALQTNNADIVVVPQWEGVFGDVWAEALSELLPRRISSLPKLLSVPNEQSPLEALEKAAVAVGLQILPNGSVVKTALAKVRPLAQAKQKSIQWPTLNIASHSTFGVIGARTLLQEELLVTELHNKLAELQVHAVYGHQLPTKDLLKRAERLENWQKRTLGDLLTFGAASALGAKSVVRGLIFVHSAGDAATQAAQQRLVQKLHKPQLFLGLKVPQDNWDELANFVKTNQVG